MDAESRELTSTTRRYFRNERIDSDFFKALVLDEVCFDWVQRFG